MRMGARLDGRLTRPVVFFFFQPAIIPIIFLSVIQLQHNGVILGFNWQGLHMAKTVFSHFFIFFRGFFLRDFLRCVIRTFTADDVLATTVRKTVSQWFLI